MLRYTITLLLFNLLSLFVVYPQEKIYFDTSKKGNIQAVLTTEQWENASEIIIKGHLIKEDVHFLGQQLRTYPNIKKANLKDSYFNEIGMEVFSDCVGLEEVLLPNTLKTIAKRAFANCKELKSITIPYNVTSIGTEAFKDCQKLEKISIGRKVSWIGTNAFMNCNMIRIVKSKGNKVFKAKNNQLFNEEGEKIAG